MNLQEEKMRSKTQKRGKAEVVREYGPFGEGGVHGVTVAGDLVWFARTGELVAFDPDSEKVVRRIEVPADAGTAFDGENLYQLAGASILVVRPLDGRVLREIPAPGKGKDSGLAWADGYLWVGQYRDGTIHKIDVETGAVQKTLRSDRWVTGVSVVDGDVWHGTSGDDGGAELRRLASDGSVEEAFTFPEGVFVSGLEASGKGTFWCGGGPAGTLRLVRPT